MLHSIKAFNPSRCCFSASDFEDTLQEIDMLLKDIDKCKDNDSLICRKEKKFMLEKAYSLGLICLSLGVKRNPDKQLVFLLADILRIYSSLCCNESFFATKQILLAAMNLHFYSIGLINQCVDILEFSSLEDLKNQGKAKPKLFESMERLILNTHNNQCIAHAHTNTLARSYPLHRLFSLAETARWLGHCYQNIDIYTISNTENDLRFSQLFNLSESLLLLIDNETSQLALADLYFQAWPFMHQRENPNEVDKICSLYNKALACDFSLERQVKVANMRFLTLFKANRKKEALVYIEEALGLIKKLQDTEQNKFLIAAIHYHYAGYFMDAESIDLEKAELYLLLAIQYANQCRFNGEYFLCFALYDIRMTELKLVLGEFKNAKESIERALSTLKMYPESQPLYIGKAESLEIIINKALEMRIASFIEKIY